MTVQAQANPYSIRQEQAPEETMILTPRARAVTEVETALRRGQHVLLAKLDEGYDEMQRSMQDTGEVETTKLYQKIGYISLIASIAPMLGLFGTVSGMIGTFNVIATSQVQPKPAQLADGISEALVTTFMGLLVAIPMSVIYAVYRNLIANVVLEVGEITEELMGRFRGTSAAA